MWDADKQSGYGKMVYADGTVYEGHWLNGRRQGLGTFETLDGDVFEVKAHG